MREPEAKTIQGRLYRVTPLPTGKGIAVASRLAKLAGPALGKATSLSEVAAAVGDVLGSFAERLDGAEVDAILRDLAAHTMFEVTPGTGNVVPLRDQFDVHFAGNYLELIEWAKFALGVNYGPLFAALGARVRGAPGASAGAAP